MKRIHRLASILLVVVATLSACAVATAERDADKENLPPGVSTAFAGMLQLSSADFRTTAEQRGFETTADGVMLDVQTQGLKPEHRAAFERDDLHVHSFRPEYERVSVAAYSGEAIRFLAELPFVRQVAPAYGATTGGDAGAY